MTKINSKVILASKNSMTGDVLITFEWTYPRFILPEIMTHRMLSRNTASSRAIPNKKQRHRVRLDPVVPNSFGGKKAGMQAGAELTGWRRTAARWVWRGARYPALASAWALDALGVHKQISNRLIEPWTWTKQLVSGTDWTNLLAQRAHEMAEPHFQELAYQVKAQVEWINKHFNNALCITPVYRSSDGGLLQVLQPHEWHLPYIFQTPAEIGNGLVLESLKKESAAICARLSYDNPGTGKRSTADEDMNLFRRLAAAEPRHLSPLEHQAEASWLSRYHGNFKGWIQQRKEYE